MNRRPAARAKRREIRDHGLFHVKHFLVLPQRGTSCTRIPVLPCFGCAGTSAFCGEFGGPTRDRHRGPSQPRAITGWSGRKSLPSVRGASVSATWASRALPCESLRRDQNARFARVLLARERTGVKKHGVLLAIVSKPALRAGFALGKRDGKGGGPPPPRASAVVVARRTQGYVQLDRLVWRRSVSSGSESPV